MNEIISRAAADEAKSSVSPILLKCEYNSQYAMLVVMILNYVQ